MEQTETIAIEDAIEDDPWDWVEEWLDVWVIDMKDPELHLGAPSKSAGFIGGGWGGYRQPAEEWEADGKQRAIGVINAVLDDVSTIERMAVMHFKLAAIFRFREPVAEIYARVRARIGIALRAAAF